MSKINNPEIVIGKVKDTGWPIDGHILTFGLWDYDDRSSYHLYSWEDEDDEAVMMTMFQSLVETGMEDKDGLNEFIDAWEAGLFEAPGAFCIDLDKVEVVE